jgi:hypothetical protein
MLMKLLRIQGVYERRRRLLSMRIMIILKSIDWERIEGQKYVCRYPR